MFLALGEIICVYIIWFKENLNTRVNLLMFILLLLVFFCFLFFASESPSSDDVLCKLLSRPLPSVAFHVYLFFSDHRIRSWFVLIWLRLSCDHDWIRSGSANVR